MRGVVAVALLSLLSSCTDPAEPAPPDPPADSFSAPLGASCSASKAPLCASGAGLCVADVCQLQCSGRYPACPAGLVETRIDAAGGSACYCSP